MSLKRVAAAIKKHRSFLLTTHVNPEGDALGSELALYHLLRKMGKSVVVVNRDELPVGYSFLPLVKVIRNYKAGMNVPSFDCFLALDCSNISRTGNVYKLSNQGSLTVNIDHHISNTRFADINWVEPDFSSTSEMIYRLFKQLRQKIDKPAAILLYAGIMTDTGSFHYSNTTSLTHRIAGELLDFGINAKDVYSAIYENVPYSEARLLARVISGIKQAAGGKIVWAELPQNLSGRKNPLFDITEQVLTFCRQIKGVEVAAFFKEINKTKNQVRVNLRSQGRIDVNKAASFFGGGGHKAAAGITMPGRIEFVRPKVIRSLLDLVRLKGTRSIRR